MTEPQIDIPGYRLLRTLGVGGMATVYLAIQTSLDRQVAIKVMRRSGADEGLERRFLMEGRAMAKLPHRNIVGVYDIVQTPEINYIAMEYLAGGTLAEHMRDGLSLAEAIAIVVQIADGLQLAHDNGIIHRDLKPANVLFRDPGTPVITDFGIARQDDSSANRLTQTGMMVGTPTYMSPEQASDHPTDGRSDQYSLGILFYEMLTGAPPFGGSSPLQVAIAHLQQPPPPLPPQFEMFQGVMDVLLAKQPDKRYPNLKVFVRELKALLTNSDTLMVQLRSDPNQSASEQLRALGFSQSQRTSGLRTSPAALGNPGATVVLGTPTPGRGPGLPPTPAPSPVPPSRPRWLLPAAGVALALVIAAGAWFQFGREATLDPKIRAIVADTLSASDQLAAEGKLVAPPGNNAYEKVQTVLQVAPGLPEAVQRLDSIAEALRQQADAALKAGRLDEAQARVGEALAVKPDDINLLALSRQIGSAKAGADLQLKVDGLLARAASASAAGKTLGEGNDTALALLRQARELAPGQAEVERRLAELTTGALAPASEALAAGRLDEAEQALQSVSGYFSGEPAWQALQTRLTDARASALQKDRLEGLALLASRQVEAGRLAEPAGDNALESLARIREIDPAFAGGVALAADLAKRLETAATEAEKAGRLAEALGHYDQALLAAPGDAGFLERKASLEQRLGARETEINRGLAGARAAIAARHFLEPAEDNAWTRIEAVLTLDPGNADAGKLRADLPRLIHEAATALVAEGDLTQAARLLVAAGQRYPDDRRLQALRSSVDERIAAEASAARRQQELAAVRALLAKPQLSVDDAGKIGTALSGLLAADAQDREARAFRDTFVQRINGLVGAAATSDGVAKLAPLVAEVGRRLPGDPAAARLAEALALQRTAIAEREKAELAAMSGELVLNATPWAEVVSITNQADNSRVEISGSKVTPLRLSLRAGTYRVVLRHPGVREQRVLVAKVEAQKSASSAAAFPTLTPESFLDRAGYQP